MTAKVSRLQELGDKNLRYFAHLFSTARNLLMWKLGGGGNDTKLTWSRAALALSLPGNYNL